MSSLFLPIINLWMAKIQVALEVKGRRFQKDASECMNFYTGPYGFLYQANGESSSARSFILNHGDDKNFVPPPKPTFGMTLNKVAELVQIFGPSLYHRNPNRQVNPRRQEILDNDTLQLIMQAYPQMQPVLQQLQVAAVNLGAEDHIRAKLIEPYLNATPNMLDLKSHSRMAIDEALIKGMGLLWPMVYTPQGASHKVVGSFFDSVDNLVIDPDATSLYNAKWIARRRVRPKWEVAREFGISIDDLKGAGVESHTALAQASAGGINGQMARSQGMTADTIIYWEVYSKCGLGKNLQDANGKAYIQELSDKLAGDYAYLCVCDGIQFPLNCPPQLLQNEATEDTTKMLQGRFQWETPYWADGMWPFCEIAFHNIPQDPWPMSHIAPALGELKFLNWVYSTLAGKVLVTHRDFLVIPKATAEEFRSAIMNGRDLTLLEVENSIGKPISELVNFLQHPPMNKDIMVVAQQIEHLFEQRTGLTELKYGMSAKQYRSAAEAEIKQQQADVRPEEMGNKIEDAMSKLARMEALAMRWHLASKDVSPILGYPSGYLWEQFVTPKDPSAVLYDLVYRIEAGSTRKPNRSRDAENWTAVMQNLMPFYQQMAMNGNPGPYNTIVAEWSKTKDMDASGLMIQPPAPPPQQATPQG